MTAEIIEFTPTTADPVEQLEEAKETLCKQIATTKVMVAAEKKKLTRLEKLSIEDVPDKKDRVAEQIAVIEKYVESLTELELDLKALNRTKDDETEEKIQAALAFVASNWLPKHDTASYIISDEEFVFIEDFSDTPEKQNVLVRQMPPRAFIETLADDLKLKSWHLPVPRVKDLFNDFNRTYQMVRYSIDEQRWNKHIYLPIRHMEKHFIDKVETTADDYSEFFDFLMYSLSGGKKENADHIEQWILHKIFNYTKAVTTPDIVIVGHVGGNGKGIIQAIIRLMMPSMLSGKANSKTLSGNFNAIMLGKLIVFFDDQNSSEIPLDVVKQLAGSDTMIFEPKGKDQYEGEKTHSSAWFSQIMPFPLTPAGQEGGVDRRFSIMRTNITFLESIRQHMKEKNNVDVSIEESKDLAEHVVSQILLNRIEIAKWFKHLCKKHPQVNKDFTLKPLHGEDYKYFLDRQKSSYDIIWDDLIMPEFLAGHVVPIFIVKEIIHHLEGKTISDKTIVTKLKELAAQNKVEVEFGRTRISIIPSKSDKNTKQCSFIAKAGTGIKNNVFDWGKVSNMPYDHMGMSKDSISEDNFVFGTAKEIAEPTGIMTKEEILAQLRS